MAVIATENWSDRIFARGQTAQRGFLVTGVTNESDALTAVQSTFGVSEFASHPQDARLVIPDGGMSARTDKGPAVWSVLGQYSRNAGGTISQLDEPADIFPDFQDQGEPVERDTHKNAVTNSARLPFSNPVLDDYSSLFITISQWESTYDAAKVIAYTSPRPKLNSQAFFIPGLGNFLEGQLKCRCVRLSNPFRANSSELVRMNYCLEARGYFDIGDGNQVTGFAKRVQDKGRFGFFTDNGKIKTGAIKNGRNEQLADDVLLDGAGYPFSEGVLADKFYVDSPGSAQASVPMPDTVGVERTPTGVWLYYTVNDPAPFSGLGLRFT